MPQVFALALSPIQRVSLYTALHEEGAKIKDRDDGKRYRRLCAALGLDVIAKVARKHGKLAAGHLLDEDAFELFEVTTDNAECALKLLNRELSTAFEDICGTVLDALDDISRNRQPDVPQGAPKCDLSKELARWTPVTE